MTTTGRVFRVFISSTFTDLKEERNALQERVFPRLRKLAAAHGCRFQAIDLRWGVSEEAGRDHATMSICLDEIKRSQMLSPRPNFIVLLGDRYGWRPLPSQIAADEFEVLLGTISEKNRELILWKEEQPQSSKGWYRKDENAVPPEYLLREREVEVADNADAEERRAAYDREAEEWSEVEGRIRSAFLKAISQLGWEADDPRRLKYEGSATEQEILRGALNLPEGIPDAKEHVFCFFRSMRNIPEKEVAKDYLDMIEENRRDAEASERLDHLKKRLHVLFPEIPDEDLILALEAIDISLDGDGQDEAMRRGIRELLDENIQSIELREHLRKLIAEAAPKDIDPKLALEIQRLLPNIHRYEVDWGQDGPTDHHISRLCDDVYESLAGVINAEIAMLAGDELELEIENHIRFGEERVGKDGSQFIGRKKILDRISDYIDDPHGPPLAILGASGTGKSALIARAAQLASEDSTAEIVLRFVGATPGSSDGRTLLLGLCQEIARRYAGDEVPNPQAGGYSESDVPKPEEALPADFRELVEEFQRQLTRATAERPLILFLDALDQLSNSDGARRLHWLPSELPLHVHLIVSIATEPPECLDALETKLPSTNLIELEPMTRENGDELLKLWLNDVERTLQPDQFNYVLDKFMAVSGEDSGGGLPLYLKLAFEETRHWRSYAILEETALESTISGVIRKNLFGRLTDEGNHGRLVVSRSLGYMAAAKNGLSEAEMLDILSKDKEVMADFKRRSPRSPLVERLPFIVWSRLYADLEPYISERSGDGTSLMTFYHGQLGDGVRADYLAGDEGRDRHTRLAKYFLEQDLEITHSHGTTPNLRKMSELPYHFTHADDKENLETTLTDFDFLRAKIMATGPQPLIADYEEAERNGISLPSLRVVKEALRLSAHVLDEDPHQLGSQLIGRLLQSDLKSVHELLKGSRKWDRPWLRPLMASLMQPGGPLLRTLVGHRAPISAVAFTEDEQFILSSSKDGVMRIWDFETGDAVRVIPKSEIVEEEWKRAVPNGVLVDDPTNQRNIKIAYDTLEVHEVASDAQPVLFLGHNRKVIAHAFSPNGTKLVTGGEDHTVRVWDLGADNSEIRVDHPGGVTAVAVARNGKWALTGGVDGTLLLWDLDVGIETGELFGHRDRINEIVVSSDGRIAMTASSDSTVKVWDLESVAELHTLSGHEGPVFALALTPDGRRVLSASKDKKLKVWDSTNGVELSSVRGPHSMDPAIAIAADGQFAVAAYRDRTLRVWDVDTSKRISTCMGHQNTITAVVFSPDGKLIVSGSKDQTLRVWEVTTGRMRATLLGHWDYVRNLAFASKDRVVSISEDDTVRVWDLTTGREIHQLGGREVDPSRLSLPPAALRTGLYHNAPASVLTTPDGDQAVSFGVNDDTLRLWDIQKGEQIAAFTGDQVLACCAITENANIVAGTLNGQVHLLHLDGRAEDSGLN